MQSSILKVTSYKLLVLPDGLIKSCKRRVDCSCMTMVDKPAHIYCRSITQEQTCWEAPSNDTVLVAVSSGT